MPMSAALSRWKSGMPLSQATAAASPPASRIRTSMSRLRTAQAAVSRLAQPTSGPDLSTTRSTVVTEGSGVDDRRAVVPGVDVRRVPGESER